MHEAQTTPELSIVSRILQQAAIPISSPAQFDRQWTVLYIQQCFQWTDHLHALLLHRLNENTETMAMVNSFLESQQQSNRSVNRDRIASHGSTAMGILPSTAELLNPTTALRQRLLRNPGISDLARLEILRIECSNLLQHRRQQHTDTLNHELGLDPIHGLSPETLSLVNENALEDIFTGVRSHFRQLSLLATMGSAADSDGTLAELSRETIERKAQARVIFQRMCGHSRDSTVLLDHETALGKLREYKEASHSEAVEVIRHLSAMVNKVITEDPAEDPAQDPAQDPACVSRVDWTAFADALWRLERE